MESEPILKKTLYTVAAMVAAWVVFVGTVSVVAVAVTSRVVSPESGKDAPAAAEASPPSGPGSGLGHASPSSSKATRTGSHAQPI